MKKKKIKKPKKLSVAKLKKRAWTLFSIWVRSKEADWNGMVHCYTCPWYGHWRHLHAGHFIPGRGSSILFDERGVHPQCYVCNVRKHGNTLVYLDHMLLDYGQDVVDDLRREDKLIKQFTARELEAMIVDLKKKIKVKI